MGTRLTDIVFDRHEDHLYEDERAMRLTPYVMAERCLQVEAWGIIKDAQDRDYSTLTYILEGGFRGFHKMSREDLEAECKEIEDTWYELEANKRLYWEAYEDDPIWNITERVGENFDRLGRTHG